MAHLPGKFVWFEHFSHDIPAARRFYDALFGWTSHAVPVGFQTYHLIMSNGAALGGFRAAPPAAHPGWMSYLSVPDVDQSYAAAVAAGAKVLMPPTSFPPMGRGACLVDPTGAVFTIWHSAMGDRPDLAAAPFGDWCWNELLTPDPVAAVAFYRQAFGYEEKVMPMGEPGESGESGNYHLLIADAVQRAGVMQSPVPGTPAHWLPYLGVPEVDSATVRAAELGAKVLMAPKDIPEVGRFSVLQDPAGAFVARFRR